MSNIEDLVRQSLQQRAEDVEPTPALWQEVDRRVARRRRWLVAAWSLAGATALIAAAVIAPTLLASGDRTPEIEPMPPGPEEGSDDGVTEDEAPEEDAAEDGAADDDAVADDEPAPTDDTADADPDEGAEAPGSEELPAAEPMLVDPVLVATGRSIEVIGSDGRETVLEMDAEGESWIMGLAVQPGSTLDDYTAAVLTTAEGFWDLRHLHVVDGEVETWEVFPQEQHRPLLSTETTAGASVTGPVFAPDGDALAWIEGTPEDLRLRTIGWSDGPGTGERATDNAEFGLELPGSAVGSTPVLHEWIWSDPPGGPSAALVATLEEATAAAWYVPMTRQADGAWSLPANGPDGGIATDVGPSEDGRTYAAGGYLADGEPRWMVRDGDDGLVALRDPFGDTAGRRTSSTPLPDTLLPDDGHPTIWIRPIGEFAIVGSPDTGQAYLLDPGGPLASLSGDVAYLDVIR